MRLIISTLITIGTIAGVLHAQVAAPPFNPIAPPFIFNPATHVWREKSFVGGTYSTIKIDASIPGGFSGTIAEGNSMSAQGMWLQDDIAVGGGWVGTDYELTAEIGGGKISSDAFIIAGAFRLGETYSIGLALVRFEGDLDSEIENSTEISVGGMVMLGENFSLGGTLGKETVVFIASDGSTGDASQNNILLGVAYRHREGDMRFHAELFMEKRSGDDNPDFPLDEDRTSGITGEVLLTDILLGIAYLKTDLTPPSGEAGVEVVFLFLSGGWVPKEGLAVVGGFRDINFTQKISNVESSTFEIFIGAAWQF